jgi:hypothetical protein
VEGSDRIFHMRRSHVLPKENLFHQRRLHFRATA